MRNDFAAVTHDLISYSVAIALGAAWVVIIGPPPLPQKLDLVFGLRRQGSRMSRRPHMWSVVLRECERAHYRTNGSPPGTGLLNRCVCRIVGTPKNGTTLSLRRKP
jgi:hypothetical protein